MCCCEQQLVSWRVCLQVVGVKGPLQDKTYSMELEPPIDMGWFHQSVAFIVL